jgi:hypothetical protein
MDWPELWALVGIYQSWAQSVSAPVCWQLGDGMTHSGSMTFLRTESHLLGLTNAHVSDAIAGCSDETGKRCQVGGAYLDPGRLIARHPSLDLATFDLSEVMLGPVSFLADYTLSKDAPRHIAATVPTWPPRPPSEGEPVMFCGYPAIYRKEIERGNVEFKFVWFAAKLQSSSERNVGIVLELKTSASYSSIGVPPNADLGGMSGGPVFRIVDEKGIERLELAGIVYEYSELTEIALAHPLTSLAPDGTFFS